MSEPTIRPAYSKWPDFVLAVAGMGFAVGAANLPAIGLDADVLSWVIGPSGRPSATSPASGSSGSAT